MINLRKEIWVGVFNPMTDSFLIKEWISAQALKKEMEDIKIPVILVGKSTSYDETMQKCNQFQHGTNPTLD
jgi:hypothetical protein